MKNINRTSWLIILLICGLSLPSLSGLLVFPFSIIIPESLETTYEISLVLIFLVLILFTYKKDELKKNWKLFFAFFVASFSITIDLFINYGSNTVTGIASDMILSASLIVGFIIILTKAAGENLQSLFLQRGNTKLGLLIGISGFIFFAATSTLTATFLFQGQNLTLNRIIAWTPWIIVTVMANGLREELLYRGLFLRKYEMVLGSRLSNFLQATIFSLSHSVAGRGTEIYTPYTAIFVLFTLVLGLIWGYIMQKTNSVIGSILFHAGSDIPIFIGIFSNLP